MPNKPNIRSNLYSLVVKHKDYKEILRIFQSVYLEYSHQFKDLSEIFVFDINSSNKISKDFTREEYKEIYKLILKDLTNKTKAKYESEKAVFVKQLERLELLYKKCLTSNNLALELKTLQEINKVTRLYETNILSKADENGNLKDIESRLYKDIEALI